MLFKISNGDDFCIVCGVFFVGNNRHLLENQRVKDYFDLDNNKDLKKSLKIEPIDPEEEITVELNNRNAELTAGQWSEIYNFVVAHKWEMGDPIICSRDSYTYDEEKP